MLGGVWWCLAQCWVVLGTVLGKVLGVVLGVVLGIVLGVVFWVVLGGVGFEGLTLQTMRGCEPSLMLELLPVKSGDSNDTLRKGF